MIETIVVVVALIAAILIYAATRPDTFRVERSARIQAPPERVFALIEDFRNWELWSPWEKRDPDLKRTYSGAAKGAGAAYAWEGNSKVGAGRMEIVNAVPSSHVAIKLDFIRPFEGHNVAEFSLEPDGAATNLIWSMHGPSSYMAKLMGLLFNMDRMIGKDFEAGLSNLEAAATK